MTTTIIPAALLSSLLLVLACDPGDHTGEPPIEEAHARHADDAAPAGPTASAGHSAAHAKAMDAMHRMGPPPVMPNAHQAFDDIVEIIGKHYVDGPLDEDALWTAAIEGVMGRLIQLGDHRINTLLSPDDLTELKVGTSGKLVGIGVKIESVADVVVIRDVLADGPAAHARLQAGDRILGIDGERVRDMALKDVVDRIRGEEGTTVELFLQRDTDEWNETLTRGTIVVHNVESRLLSDGVGYLRIGGFSVNTAADLDVALTKLSADGMTSLVVDVRYCPGGLLDAGIEVTDRFLPTGKRIVSIRGRDASADKDIDATQDDPWESLPMAMLIGPHTASGAEIMAAALSHHGRATLVGAPTMGKGTVESVHELSDGWGLKLSISRFFSPDGQARQGVGVRPDLAIPATDADKHAPIAEVDPELDPVLGAAISLLSHG